MFSLLSKTNLEPIEYEHHRVQHADIILITFHRNFKFIQNSWCAIHWGWNERGVEGGTHQRWHLGESLSAGGAGATEALFQFHPTCFHQTGDADHYLPVVAVRRLGCIHRLAAVMETVEETLWPTFAGAAGEQHRRLRRWLQQQVFAVRQVGLRHAKELDL